MKETVPSRSGSAVFIADHPRLPALHAAELPQKDHLCGAFWGSLALRAFGIREVQGEPVDQDLVAFHAGTTICTGDDALPPRARSRVDYRLQLPEGAVETSGSSAPGVARSIEELSDGRLAVVPIAGPWNPYSVLMLLELTASVSSDIVLIANVRTGHFWNSRTPVPNLLAHLAGQGGSAPSSEWDVGHFVMLVLAASGPRGALVCIRDTYPSLGFGGYHLQPADAVAAALNRGDGHEGGILCVVPAEHSGVLRRQLASKSFDIRLWDNGSLDLAGG